MAIGWQRADPYEPDPLKMTPPTLSIDALLSERMWLSRVCDRLVRDAAEADDVAQEAIMRALDAPSAAQAHAGGKLRGWLAVTARNVLHERARSARRRRGRESDVARVDVSAEPSVEDAMAGAELREQLARLVMELPEHEREVVVLRYYEGLRPREIAARLDGVSEGAVRQRLYRGMERLRTSLDVEAKEKGRAWLPAAVGFSKLGPQSAQALGGGTLLGALAVCALLVLGGFVFLSPPDVQPGSVRAVEDGELGAATSAGGGGLEPVEADADRLAAPAIEGTRGAREFRLIDPRDGTPIAGSEWSLMVTGVLDPEPYGGMDPVALPTYPPLASGITGPKGEIELPALEHDLAQLLISRTDRHATASFAIDGRVLGGSIEVLHPPVGGSVTGRVVDHEGKALADVEIVELDSRDRLRPAGRTDDAGRFTVSGLTSVPRQLIRREDGEVVSIWSTSSGFFMRSGPGALWNRLPVSAEDRQKPREGAAALPRDLGDVPLKEFTIVAGQVVDSSGVPVEGVIVGLEEWFQRRERLKSVLTGPRDVWSPATMHRDFTPTDAEGRFRMRIVPPRYWGRGQRLRAVAPDGATGRVIVEGEDHEVSVRVDHSDAIRFQLRDRTRPDDPLELLPDVAREVAWYRLQDRRIKGPDRRIRIETADLLPSDVLVLPKAGFRRRAKDWGIWLEVPGYEPVEVPVTDPATMHVVDLDRRPRRRVRVELIGETALPDQTTTLFLISRPLEDPARLAQFSWSYVAPPETGTSGGLIRRVRSGDTIEFAPPFGKPFWLVALPDPQGPYRLVTSTVVGPFESLETGAVIDVELEPWDASDQWGPRDLTRGTVVPLH